MKSTKMERINSISKYLTQDLNSSEKKSYFEYLKGFQIQNVKWIEKSLERREVIINMELKCKECEEYINVRESGDCSCINSHDCTEYVLYCISTN
jgi:hypothetical protein